MGAGRLDVGGADLLHPPHRQVDPAAAGDREHRARPLARDRRRRRPAAGPAPSAEGRARRWRSCSCASTRTAASCARRAAATCSSCAWTRWSPSPPRSHAVIRLLHRPGHFVVEGQPLADVWPAGAAAAGRHARSAARTPPARTARSTQDLSFAVDQLVEIAIRALSPAVNDTFTALTCIDWLGDGLCKIADRWQPDTGAPRRRRPRARDRGHVSFAAWSSARTRRSARPAAACRR